MQLRDILRFGILSIVFIIPFICLIVADQMFFPFITGKNFTFRILVELMLGMWILLVFLDAKYRPRFSWALACAGGFLAVLTIADFLGANPYRSFWSNYERMEGLITHAHLFLYFLIAGSVLLEERTWKYLLRTSLGVSVITAFYGFAQLSGAVEIHQSTTRIDGTFGNSTYFAIYAAMHIFIAALLYLKDGAQNKLRWIYGVVAFLNLIILYYTQTRGAILGLIGGTFLALLLVALFDKERPQLRKYAVGGVVTVVLLILGFLAIKNSDFVMKNPVLNRFATISLTEQTTVSRFMIWQMSFDGFKERPIFGWGQDNFIYVFAKYYNPKMWNQEPWFDRSHDVFFDWLIAGGALGLLAYLSLFGVMLYYLWFGKRHEWSVPEKAAFTGMLAGYFVHNIFVFDNLTSYIIFFSLLAYIHSQHVEPLVEVPVKGKQKQYGIESQDIAIAALVISVATGALLYFVNIRNINANYALIDALRNPLVDDGQGGKKIAIKSVLDLDLFGTSEAREQLGQLALQAQDPRIDPKLRAEIFALASQQFDDELKKDPENLRVLSFTALLYSRYGKYDQAEALFKRAIAVSPNRQSTYLDMGSMYATEGRYEDAKTAFKTAYDLDPDYPDARMYYAIGLIYTKDFATANEVLAPLLAAKDPQAYDPRLINAFGNNGQFDAVVSLINEKISLNRAEGRDYLALGGAYLALGDKEKALAAFQTAENMDATLKDQAEQFISQVKGAVKTPTKN